MKSYDSLKWILVQKMPPKKNTIEKIEPVRVVERSKVDLLQVKEEGESIRVQNPSSLNRRVLLLNW
jgi:hypothetical protein